MRLRDLSERVREVMDGSGETLVGADTVHALVQNIDDVQMLYRNVESAGKSGGLVGWLTYSFEPFGGLIEPLASIRRDFGHYRGFISSHQDYQN